MGSDILIVCLAGGIGVGKTTLVQKLQATGKLDAALNEYDVDVTYVLEPSKLWSEMGWLKQFYEDRVKNAFPFQLVVYHTHIEATAQKILAAKREGRRLLVISERGIFCQKLFFHLQQKNALEETAYELIWKCHRILIPPVAGVIYLKLSPEQAMERYEERRARKMKDSTIQLDQQDDGDGPDLAYQTRLIETHEQWYTDGKCCPPGMETPVPCMHVDVSEQPYHKSDHSLDETTSKILHFIKTQIF